METDFEQVYGKYYPAVYRYLMSLCKNPDIAEELTQETFFKALKHIDRYDPRQKMLTWLCAIAKNTYFTEYRRQQRNLELDEAIPQSDDLVERLLDREDNSAILKLVHRLDEPYKEVFTLRIYAELTFREIGDIFGRSENWARVTFYRSKSKIKEKIDL